MKWQDKTKKKACSDKIEINRSKVYTIRDPIQLAYIFYPHKTANLKRAAFLAIFFEMKNAPKQRLESTDHIAEKYGLSQSSITKVRAKMTRIGLIRKVGYYWIFSSILKNTLLKLLEVIELYKTPAERTQLEREMMYIDIAKQYKSMFSR